MQNPFAGRHVLVTGAGGSIGSELCRQIVSDNAASLKLLSLTEAGLYNIDRTLRRDFRKYRETKIVPILGSVRDRRLLAEVLPGVDLVIHAAAHKHVPICEANPLAAIENNVGGTWNLAAAAAAAGVAEFCLISTDKAVKPISVMGMTKRLAELILRDVPVTLPLTARATRFFTVRFGNVLDSAGSVLPLWREQIAAGGPVTITDYRCERYFMTVGDAVHLIGTVVGLHPTGGTFVLDMGPPRRLIDMAKELCRRAAYAPEILTIGLRPGEKLTEELHYGGELVSTSAPGVFIVEEPTHAPLDFSRVMDLLEAVAVRDLGTALDIIRTLTGRPEA